MHPPLNQISNREVADRDLDRRPEFGQARWNSAGTHASGEYGPPSAGGREVDPLGMAVWARTTPVVCPEVTSQSRIIHRALW